MRTSTADAAEAEAVTTREREVWSLVADHLTNREIADRLCLSVRTVESHVSSLIRRLQVADRRELARRAVTDQDEARRCAVRWPSPITSFVGREREAAELAAAIAAHRLVTATGPGGVGKTRLAARAAHEVAATRRDGGWFVDLARITGPDDVLPAVTAAVGAFPVLGGAPHDALVAVLADSDAVVVLDNCEHVLDAACAVTEVLLARCPRLSLVATSRARMQAPFEWVFPVPGLTVDGAGDAVSLFAERARGAGFRGPLDRQRVAALCASLDGMALAIELAAARCPTLGLDGLLGNLDRRLRILTARGNADPRHRSLRDTIAWSYGLLGEEDRFLLAATSVFAAWYDVDAVSLVALPGAPGSEVADRLARLADHNLLLVDPGTPTRYRALESIRQFGAERLHDLRAAGQVHARHAAWCQSWLDGLARADRADKPWCTRLDEITADAHLAINDAARRGDDVRAACLAEMLAGLLLLRGRPQECQRAYEQAARHADGPGEGARLTRLAAGAAASRLVGNDTLRLLEESAAHAAASGDTVGAGETLAWMAIYNRWAPGIIAVQPETGEDERWLGRAHLLADGAPEVEATITLARVLGLPDHDPRAAVLATAAAQTARAARHPLLESTALDALCTHHLARGELTKALRTVEVRGSVLAGVRLDANTAYHFNDYLLMASEVHLAAGRLQAAADHADRLSDLACYRDYPHPAIARRIKVDAMAGHHEAAVARGEQFLVAWERAGRPVSGTLNVSTYSIAMVHGMRGDEGNRSRWVEVTRALTRDPARLASGATGWAPTFDALLDLHRGHPAAALRRLSVDLDDATVWGGYAAGMWRPWYAAAWAEASLLAGRPDLRHRLAQAREATRENPVAARIVARAADLADGKIEALTQHSHALGALGCTYQQRRTLLLSNQP